MNVWKQFCRHIEDKKTVQRFGDMIELIDTCAIFEFTDEQIHRAQDEPPADLSAENPHPIPPFPFPRMCMVGSGGVIVLQSPLMDEETGRLEFQIMVFQPVENKDPLFQMATCVVESTRLDDDGRFPMEISDHRGAWGTNYWEGDGPGNPFASGEMEDDWRETERLRREAKGRLGEAEKALRVAEARGDTRKAEKLREVRDAVLRAEEKHLELLRQVDEKNAELRTLGEEMLDEQRQTLHEAFYLGLQEVNWINHPDHFTVAVAGADVGAKGRKSKKHRIRRLGDRTRHIVLTKREIGAAWRRVHGEGTHAPPIPHLRRGHYRILRAARYKEKRGQVVWVRATHVAGHCVEWREGDVRYKVI